MDLLGSIMSSMDKPPSLSDKEKQVIKKNREEKLKKEAANKERLTRFKDDIEEKFKSHFNQPENLCLKFHPMDHVFRSIIHEVAESQGLLTFAFGTDGVDRYVRVYRKDKPPCEDELAARRRGDPWNEEIKRQLDEKRHHDEVESLLNRKRKPEKFVPNTNYKDKYVHLIGQDSALDAAKKTETNKSYGFVPSENKKDLRSIEQTMADIKAKKKQKLSIEHESEQSSH